MARVDIDFVIIGAQKAGSTSLAADIAQHPAVWMPESEVPVFRDPLYSPSAMARFRAEIAAVPGRLRRGIKCPDYLARPEVPARLLDQETRPRLILTLRNPVSRTISAYFWYVRWGLLPLEEPNLGLQRVLAGFYRTSHPRSDEIVDWSRYGQHIGRYLEWFTPEDMLVVLSENMRRDPDAVYGKVFRFLDVSDSFRPIANRRRANEGIYHPSRLRFVRLRNRHHLRWSPDRTYVTIGAPHGVGPRVASMAIAGFDRYLLATTLRSQPPALSAETMNALRYEFQADIATLEATLGVDLSSWKS